MGLFKKQDEIEAQRLCDVLARNIGTNTAQKVAGMAYLQAATAQCGVQALVDLLKHKGIISDTDLEAALASSYRKRRDHAEDNSIIAAPAPTVRPRNGS